MVRAARPGVFMTALCGLSVTLGLALVGCGETDPDSAAYWQGQLKGAEKGLAIRQAGNDKVKVAVDPLIEAYAANKGTSYAGDIIRSLVQIGDQKATPVLLEALADVEDPATGKLAGSTLLEWGAKEHLDKYLEILANKGIKKETKLAVLELVAAYADKRAADLLIPILKSNPDITPMIFIGLAAEGLGRIPASDLGADRTGVVVENLIRCLWLDDHLGRNEVPRCRMALNRIGPGASVDALITTLERKNAVVEARARKLRFDRGGLIEAKAAELLGDMPDAKAADALVKALTADPDITDEIKADDKRFELWIKSDIQKTIGVATALAVIGDDKGVPPLVELAAHKEQPLEKKLVAVQQVAYLGSQAALPGLMKILKDAPHPRDPVSQPFRMEIALSMGRIIDGSDEKMTKAFVKELGGIIETMEKYKADLAKQKETAEPGKKRVLAADIKAYTDWINGYKRAQNMVTAVEECKNDAACWSKKLADTKTAGVQLKSAYRLGQLTDSKKVAAEALATQMNAKNLALRDVVLFGMSRLGETSLIGAVQKSRDEAAAKMKSNRSLRPVVYTLDLMLAKLSHKK